MRDSRLNQVLALLDDSRCLLVDLVDDAVPGTSLRELNQVDAARQSINVAIEHVRYATDPEPAA